MSSDTPFALALSALESIPALTDTKDTGFAWTIYTGDLVSHDPDNQLSRFVLVSSIYDRSSSFICTGATLNIPRYSAFNLHLFISLFTVQQTVLYDLFKEMLGTGPVYPALGNHDSYNQSVAVCVFGAYGLYHLRAQDAPHALGGALADQFSWYVLIVKIILLLISCRNYDHVAGLWETEGWLPDAAVQLSRAQYGAYMVQRTDGLRIITLNADFCKGSL